MISGGGGGGGGGGMCGEPPCVQNGGTGDEGVYRARERV